MVLFKVTIRSVCLFVPLLSPCQMDLIWLQPRRLMSPDTLLTRRTGNSFEMATLLCCIMLGQGFRNVFVVSGYASREVVNNDQRRVVCPVVPGPFEVSIMILF